MDNWSHLRLAKRKTKTCISKLEKIPVIHRRVRSKKSNSSAILTTKYVRNLGHISTLNKVIDQCQEYESSKKSVRPESAKNQFNMLGEYVNRIDLAVKTNTLDFFYRQCSYERAKEQHKREFLSDALNKKIDMLSCKELKSPKIWCVRKPFFSKDIERKLTCSDD